MTIRITGKVIRGEGNANKNHFVLMPLLAAQIPEIANCSQFGTINVQLDQGMSLDKSRADVWTRRIIWSPIGRTERRIEAFGFINIRLECPPNGPAHACWIILPEGSKLTYRDDKAEIIADILVEGLEYGADCAIDIDHTPSSPAPPSFGALYGLSFKKPSHS